MTTQGDMERERERMEAITDRLKNMAPALEVIGSDIVTFIDDRFDESTGPAGNGWKALEPSTLRSRRGTTAKILVDTGRLRQSINYRIEGDTLRFGTNVEYGAYHQTGTSRMAQRRFLPVIEAGGEFVRDDSGPAGELWRSVEETARTYIETGEIT